MRELALEFHGNGRFDVVRQLGEGGMGVVYEAVDRDRGARIALKALRHLDPRALYRFKREFRTLHELHHPNLVRIEELVEHDGAWFFTMELVPGVDFLSYVRGAAGSSQASSDHETFAAVPHALRRAAHAPPAESTAPCPGNVDLDRLRRTLGQLASGLGALHGIGKVHRDIKPSNVLVTASGKVVLIDFGVVCDTRAADRDTADTFVGTIAYMAPEQAAGQPVGPPADWYALGVMIYEALTGRLPFDGSTLQVAMDKQRDEPPPPSAIAPGVPADLDALCRLLLHRDPEQRADRDAVLRCAGVVAPRLAAEIEATYAWPVVGRDDELATLRAAYDEVRRGGAVTVLVTGESGIGKSALIRELVTSLGGDAEDDVTVLSGRCYERESVPYKALDGVIDALVHFLRGLPELGAAAMLPPDAALLRRVFPVLGGVEAIARAPAPRREIQDPLELRRRAFAALRQLLMLLCERHRPIITIDDLQWADADSVLLLHDLLCGPDPPALLLVTSVRTDARGELPAIASQLPGAVRRLELRSLEAGAAERLAATLLRHYRIEDVDPAEVAIETDGHPLYLSELVRHLATRAEASSELPRLDEAIGGRVARLSPSARSVLDLVCLGGGPLHREVLRRSAELSERAFRAHVALLRAGHFVRGAAGSADRLEPYHDRVREAVVRRIEPSSAIAGHQRLAFALDAASAAVEHPDLLLYHLQRAGETRRAADVAISAAERATSAFAFERAADLYTAALQLGDFDPDRARELTHRLAGSLVHAGRRREAADMFERAAEGADPVTRLECMRQAAEQLLRNGHIEEGIQHLHALLTEVGLPFPATPRRALASLMWQRARLRLRGDKWTLRSPREIADRDLLTVDLCTAVGQTLGWVDNIRGSVFQVRGLRLALDLGEPVRLGRALGTEASYQSSQGGRGVERGAALCAELYALAEKSRAPFLSVFAQISEGVCSYFAGRFRHAARKLQEAEALSRDQLQAAVNELASARLARMRSLRMLGGFREMRTMFEVGVREAARCGDRYSETNLRRCCSILFLAADDVAGAHDNLSLSLWTLQAKAFHVQHWYELEARGELALYERAGADVLDRLAADLVAADSSLLTRVQTARVVVAWLRGRMLLGEARRDRASLGPAIQRHARRLRREHVPYAAVFARLLDAGVATCVVPTDDAATRWRSAADAADAAELAVVAACARWRAGEVTGGLDGATLMLQAEEALRTAGIVQPARFVEVCAPGGPSHT